MNVRALLLGVTVALFALLQAPALHAQGASQEDAQQWQDWFNKGLDALNKEDNEGGIAAFKKCIELIPDQPVPYYNIACGYAKMGKTKQAMKYLKLAKEKGWFDIDHMAKDSDMDNLRDLPDYKALVKGEEDRRRADAVDNTFYKTYRYKGYDREKEHPVLVVLHGEMENAYDYLENYKAFADESHWLIVSVQGSVENPQNPDQAMWDMRVATDMVLYALERVQKRYKIDKNRVLLSGFGQGALMAVRAAAKHPERFRGVVSVCGIYLHDEVKKVASKSARGKVSVAFLQGKDDPSALRDGRTLIDLAKGAPKQLRSLGIRGRYETYAGAHEFPKDAPSRINDAIAWILEAKAEQTEAPEPIEKPDEKPASKPSEGEEF